MMGVVKNLSFGWWLAATYFIGSYMNHALYVLMHDLIHFTMFESRDVNLLGAIVANLAQGLPSAISFGRFHRDHHAYLSVPMIDPDIPAPWEVKMFKYSYTKVLFIMILPFLYLGRPMFMHPKKISFYEALNWVVCISFNTFVYRQFGLQSVLYLIVGSLMGLSINPCGTHLLAEHFEYVKGQETFSYYGPLNYINLNMGLHVEHHDFPMMPWHRLSKLRKIAPEFYEKIPSHSSYLGVWIRFIFDDTMGAPCRISRINPTPIDTSRLE
jgi:sphingolipid delta-4 desaturase